MFATIFEIDPLGDGRSRLRQFVHFSGVLVPFMRGVFRDTQAAFELANEAIKQRARTLARGAAARLQRGWRPVSDRRAASQRLVR